MDKKETAIFLKCDCGCSMIVVKKSEWENGDVDYDISVQDSRYDHNYTLRYGVDLKARQRFFLESPFIIVMFILAIRENLGNLLIN
jgi:hypothetical protein